MLIVQDLFLNETAKFRARVPAGLVFWRRTEPSPNAERRIGRVRKVMPPLAGYEDWQVTMLLSRALGYPMTTRIRRKSWRRSRDTPTFAGSATRTG